MTWAQPASILFLIRSGEEHRPGSAFLLNKRMTPEQLAPVLEQLGCPVDKSLEMAAQLDKRARQLAEREQRSYEESMTHLLALMKQGWAAKHRGL